MLFLYSSMMVKALDKGKCALYSEDIQKGTYSNKSG